MLSYLVFIVRQYGSFNIALYDRGSMCNVVIFVCIPCNVPTFTEVNNELFPVQREECNRKIWITSEEGHV